MTIEQFALLNTVWAITIVCAEVPSGALADLLGRKRLLVLTSVLMIVEISVIAFVPISSITVVFWAFLVNRIVSGLAEAMASGADEAIAYDSLVENGNPEHWPQVLSVQMRLKALAGIISMTAGAMLYDPELVNRLLALLGMEAAVSQQVSMRFPVYLTLVLAFLSLWTTLGLKETGDEGEPGSHQFSLANILQAGRLTWQAGLWIMKTPFAMAIILFGMMYDHVLRLMITLTSQYFRLILLPEASFGLIMAPALSARPADPEDCRAYGGKIQPTAELSLAGAHLLSGPLGAHRLCPLLRHHPHCIGERRPAVNLLFHQPLFESGHLLETAGNRAKLQGNGFQSGLWSHRHTLCAAHAGSAQRCS